MTTNSGVLKRWLIQGTALLVTSSPLWTMAAGGGALDGGGGTRIEAIFRIRARELIEAIEINTKANSLCSATTLRGTMASKILVVSQLVDSKGRCKGLSDLDACSYPGEIQLKKNSWEKFFGSTKTSVGGRGTDALILHEIYRATPGCNDDDFQITDQVMPIVELTPAALAPPKFSRSTCFTTMVIQDKAGKTEKSEFNSDDLDVLWSDGSKQFSLGSREFEETTGERHGMIAQFTKVRRATSDPELRLNSESGKYVDIDPKGSVTSEKIVRDYEIRGSKNKFIVKEVTFSDPDKNLGAMTHTLSEGPKGSEISLQVQTEPDPFYVDGSRRLSHTTQCTKRPITPEEVKYDGIFKVKKQIEKFSEIHEKTMLAKNIWQACQEKDHSQNCTVQMAAFEKSEAERTEFWKNLIKESDLGSKKSGAGSGGNNSGGSSGGRGNTGRGNGGEVNQCTTPEMQNWFNQCIYHRPNCWDLQPGGACYGVDGWFSRCTGRRPPMRGSC